MPLPKDNALRKALPLYDFLVNYFPDAFIEVCKVAVAGNVQHKLGPPLRWVRGVSMDQLNTAMRHMVDHGMGNVFDEEPPEVLAAINAADAEHQDSTMHLAKAAWRILAQIQLICEERDAARGQGSNVEEFPEAFQLYPVDEPTVNVSDVVKVTVGPLTPGRLELACGCKGFCKGTQGCAAVVAAQSPPPVVPMGTGPKNPAGMPYASMGGFAMVDEPKAFDPAD